MKLAELIQEYEFNLNAKAEAALRSFDWNYDVDPFDGSRFKRGEKAMVEVQDSLKNLYSKSPEDAEKLWVQHCPYARGTLPSWIFS